MVLKKFEIEEALRAEHQEISAGRLKEDNPLDTSDGFRVLCQACRQGNLVVCHEKIAEGVDINARDPFDYTPLILASLCGHYEVVQLLLESGALCERDTFQGERCLYNALNDRIRDLLLSYDYSKSANPLQPLASHVSSLLNRETPRTCDLTLLVGRDQFLVHKFILAARSPYFARKLRDAPETTSWRLPNSIPLDSLYSILKFAYLSDIPLDLGDGEEEKETLTGIDKLSRQLELERIFMFALLRTNRRLLRQRMSDELSRGRDELEVWFRANVLGNKIIVGTEVVDRVKWDRNNAIFADVLLRADEDFEEENNETDQLEPSIIQNSKGGPVIPIGPAETQSSGQIRPRSGKSVLYPAHRAMLLRSEYFLTMFSSSFREAHETEHLHIIQVDCSPEVLEIVLTFLYTERADFPLNIAIDVLYAADQLFIEKLKVKAAVTISSLGSGSSAVRDENNSSSEVDSEDTLDIYEVVRTAWVTRVQRLEEFAARYFANRLERFIDEEEFALLVKESAERVKGRQETDTIELVDDIRHYLSERFRLRFEEAGIDDMLEGENHTQVGDDAVEELNAKVQGVESHQEPMIQETTGDVVRTLDGEIASDEFEEEAQNYRILLAKIDALLVRLGLEA